MGSSLFFSVVADGDGYMVRPSTDAARAAMGRLLFGAVAVHVETAHLDAVLDRLHGAVAGGSR